MRKLLLALTLVAFPGLSGCLVAAESDSAVPEDPARTQEEALNSSWHTGPEVGHGVARKDTHNPLGENVFIGYAGYNVNRDAACAWTSALYHASLRDRGVRYLYCVQGPADPTYAQQEIGNSKIIANVLKQIGPQTHFILAVGHSSGTFVAHELLAQLASGADPHGHTKGKVVYFNLDGGESGLTHASVNRLRKAYFVGAHDHGTRSPNYDTMQSAGQTYGGFWSNNSNNAGCNSGAPWCVHVSLITTRPHDPSNADAIPDYSDFAGRPVAHAYIDAKAEEAGLEP